MDAVGRQVAADGPVELKTEIFGTFGPGRDSCESEEGSMVSRRLVASFYTREQEFHVLQSADARAAAQRFGFELEILDATDNAVLQIQQLFRYIHAPEEQRPRALVVQTRVPDGLERLARNAASAGIGWVLLNRTAGYIDVLRGEHPDLPIFSVTTDHEEIGRIQARQFHALLPRGGSVLYVQGPPETVAAQARLKGMESEAQGKRLEVKIVSGEWTEASAERAVSAWLRLKSSESFHPDLVGCQNDAMAVGARTALRAQRPAWAHLAFTGCDGLPESGQRLVHQGLLAATIVLDSCAGPAVELLARARETGEASPPSMVIPPHSLPPVEELRPRP